MSVPALVSETVPLPSAMTPAKVVLVLLAPEVRVTAPATLLVTLLPAAPASEPIASLKPLRSNIALAATVRALLEPIALAMPSLIVPTLIRVSPV